ncbi:hypothetical protein M8J77_017183 [Diaphorina citri]|nr:hypothetical protein M8J77_017183 [Diaphorina citri]
MSKILIVLSVMFFVFTLHVVLQSVRLMFTTIDLINKPDNLNATNHNGTEKLTTKLDIQDIKPVENNTRELATKPDNQDKNATEQNGSEKLAAKLDNQDLNDTGQNKSEKLATELDNQDLNFTGQNGTEKQAAKLDAQDLKPDEINTREELATKVDNQDLKSNTQHLSANDNHGKEELVTKRDHLLHLVNANETNSSEEIATKRDNQYFNMSETNGIANLENKQSRPFNAKETNIIKNLAIKPDNRQYNSNENNESEVRKSDNQDIKVREDNGIEKVGTNPNIPNHYVNGRENLVIKLDNQYYYRTRDEEYMAYDQPETKHRTIEPGDYVDNQIQELHNVDIEEIRIKTTNEAAPKTPKTILENQIKANTIQGNQINAVGTPTGKKQQDLEGQYDIKIAPETSNTKNQQSVMKTLQEIALETEKPNTNLESSQHNVDEVVIKNASEIAPKTLNASLDNHNIADQEAIENIGISPAKHNPNLENKLNIDGIKAASEIALNTPNTERENHVANQTSDEKDNGTELNETKLRGNLSDNLITINANTHLDNRNISHNDGENHDGGNQSNFGRPDGAPLETESSMNPNRPPRPVSNPPYPRTQNLFAFPIYTNRELDRYMVTDDLLLLVEKLDREKLLDGLLVISTVMDYKALGLERYNLSHVMHLDHVPSDLKLTGNLMNTLTIFIVNRSFSLLHQLVTIGDPFFTAIRPTLALLIVLPNCHQQIRDNLSAFILFRMWRQQIRDNLSAFILFRMWRQQGVYKIIVVCHRRQYAQRRKKQHRNKLAEWWRENYRREPNYGQSYGSYGRSFTNSGRNEPNIDRISTNYDGSYSGRNDSIYGRSDLNYGQNEPNYGQNDRTYGQKESNYRGNEPNFGRNNSNYSRNEPNYYQNDPNNFRNDSIPSADFDRIRNWTAAPIRVHPTVCGFLGWVFDPFKSCLVRHTSDEMPDWLREYFAQITPETGQGPLHLKPQPHLGPKLAFGANFNLILSCRMKRELNGSQVEPVQEQRGVLAKVFATLHDRPDNLQGCQLHISIYHRLPTAIIRDEGRRIDGMDGEVLFLLAKSMNFTPHLHISQDKLVYGLVEDPGSNLSRGTFADVLTRKVDLNVNGHFVKPEWSREPSIM